MRIPPSLRVVRTHGGGWRVQNKHELSTDEVMAYKCCAPQFGAFASSDVTVCDSPHYDAIKSGKSGNSPLKSWKTQWGKTVCSFEEDRSFLPPAQSSEHAAPPVLVSMIHSTSLGLITDFCGFRYLHTTPLFATPLRMNCKMYKREIQCGCQSR